MKKFTVQMADNSYLCVNATRMEQVDNMIYAYNGSELVAVVEITAIIEAHISEKGVEK